MPQSSSEQSLVTNIYPVLMGKSDILVKDDFGHTNPLEVGDYTHHHNNRELVNLENASVNIDNSSDVIIGPVTQFNVNGNVTIYQNENGPTSTDGGGDNHDEKTNSYDEVKFKRPLPTQPYRFLPVCMRQRKKHLIFVIIVTLIAIITLTIYFLLSKSSHELPDESQGNNGMQEDHLGNHTIYQRKDWQAMEPSAVSKLGQPANLVIISHSATDSCSSFQACAKRVKSFQDYHMNEKAYRDICYNFLIGGDDCTGQKQKNHGSWIIEIRTVFSGKRHLIWICSTLSVAVIILLAIAVIFIRKWTHHVVQYDDQFSDPIYGSHLGNHSIFYRRDWGGLPPKVDIVYLRHPVPLLIISHSATKPCYSLNLCSKRMNWLQKDHQTTVNDIGMNFAIGGDGNIYVGRGWDIENYRRKSSVLIAFIGDYIYDTLTENMLDAAQRLIAQGVELGKLSNDYGMVGENQTTPSRFLSPGDNVYKIIKSWPHFINKTMF